MPDTRETAEAIILVDRARTDAGSTHLRSLFRGNEIDGADAQRREAERGTFAADMAVLERSPTRADIARITARYAHVHARAVRDAAVEPSAFPPPAGAVKAVLLDWAGTVAHHVSTREWLEGALDEAKIAVPARDRDAWLRQAEAAGLPSVRRPADLSPHSLAAWWRRDLDPGAHQEIYVRRLEEAGLPWPEAAGALYRRTMNAAGWRIDPAARRAMVRLSRAGVLLTVVSNIGWDLRPVLRRHDLMTWISDCVMSWDVAARKPAPTIFSVACQRLGVQPRNALMVGDNPEADQGGKALGIRTIILPKFSGEDRWEPVLDAALGPSAETSS